MAQAQLKAQLDGLRPKFGEPTEVTVKGAERAVEYTVEYTTKKGTSVKDTELKATDVRQFELSADGVGGQPKLGFRFGSPADQDPDGQWKQIRESIVVHSGGGDGA